jgi:hypothetical protein
MKVTESKFENLSQGSIFTAQALGNATLTDPPFEK